MKKNEVKTGKYYTAKVSNRMATIRIDAENPNGGWNATNITTGKKVRIKSAQRLRHETRPPGKSGAELKAIHAADQENARLDEQRAASADGMTASERAMAESAPRAKRAKKAAKEAKAPPKRDTGKRGAPSGQPKRLSALNAAVKVLEERDPADGPLSCAQMIERMAAKGYWTPVRGGKTPANTLYAAILREINTKGEDSRFEKVQRGRFTLTLKG